MKHLNKLLSILIIAFVAIAFTFCSDEATTENVELFESSRYDEAKSEFKNMIEQGAYYVIDVKDDKSWKEYLLHRSSEILKDVLASGENELRYHNDSKLVYLSSKRVDKETSDKSFTIAISNRVGGCDVEISECANYCPGDGTCYGYWHVPPYGGDPFCMIWCCDPRE